MRQGGGTDLLVTGYRKMSIKTYHQDRHTKETKDTKNPKNPKDWEKLKTPAPYVLRLHVSDASSVSCPRGMTESAEKIEGAHWSKSVEENAGSRPRERRTTVKPSRDIRTAGRATTTKEKKAGE